jgi:cation diffusion facilitator CzcD-associated flavoprotein CzcO
VRLNSQLLNIQGSRSFFPRVITCARVSAEIRDYIRGTAQAFGVRPFIRLNTTVCGAEWSSDKARWLVHAVTKGQAHEVRGGFSSVNL